MNNLQHYSITPEQLRMLAKELESDIGQTATQLYIDTMTGKVSPFEMGNLVARRSLLLGLPSVCRALAIGLDNLNGAVEDHGSKKKKKTDAP